MLNVKAIAIAQGAVAGILFVLCRLVFTLAPDTTLAAMKYLTIRYVSDPTLEPASLYYSARGKYRFVEGACQFADCHPSERSIVIASERLNENDGDWIRVAPNHVLTVGRDREVNVELMGIERRGSRCRVAGGLKRDTSV